MNLSELLKKISIDYSVKKECEITAVCAIENGEIGKISFLGNPKYAKFLKETKASAVFVSEKGDFQSETAELIPVANPSKAFSDAIQALGLMAPKAKPGRHSSAVVSSESKIGDACIIGPHVVIEEGAVIGNGVELMANVYVGANAVIGDGCKLYPSVAVYHGCQLGKRVVVHANTTIGSDGFGFEMEGNIEKIPQIGIVIVGNDVEIGANVSIDRARFDATKIGDFTKIDNLVQIGHNVQIGKGCFIVAQVGIAGSTKIGNQVIIAGQAGLVGHIEIGDGAMIAAKTGVGNNVPAGGRLSGHYGVNHKDYLKQMVCLQQLPELMKKVKKFLK